jgi:site-specific DNA recombinase
MEQIAMYLRLSKEDEFSSDESNSITNQLAFIRSYINKDKALSKMNVLEFVDDGYTGKNMDSPGMQRMLDLVKKKQTSCVIVKDFSRFSRDRIEQGKYIEQILPFMGVRFIAINDNYDSADYVGGIGEIDVAFKGILYDFFSEEQSVKVSTTLDAKRGSGKYISAFAPYGYMKSPEDKHKLVVDEYASQIVKRIFREYLSGKSMYKIAESLNQEGIATPGVYIATQKNIEKQKVAVSKMAQFDLPEVAGFEMLEGQMKLQKLNKEIVDVFVEGIVVYAKDRVEIKWKFRDEFKEAGKDEICSN